MAASFPGTLWVWTDQVDNTSAMDAADVNSPAAEIIAMQSHFGAGSIVGGQIILNSAAGVDPWVSLQINSVEKFRFGVDDSDSDKLKINTGALADPSLWEMSSTGHIELTNVAETASDPGRHLYLQRIHTGAVGSGKGLTGVEVRSTFNGSADALTSEVKGGEFKARHTTGNTYDVGTFKGVIGNVDVKNGTVTTGWAVEGAIDVSSGGTFTTAACFHGNLNNSGTVTTSYGAYLHGLSGYTLTYGVYIDYATTGLDINNITTGIDIGACTTGINITGATTDAIKVTGTPTTSDITLHNGATIMNTATNGGTLTVTEDNIVLVGGGWGKIAFGGYTDWGTGATGTLIDGTGYDWVTATVGHVDSGALAAACAAGYHALTVTPASHTTASSFFGTWTELYIQATQDLTNTANCAAVWGQIEMGASVETTATATCFMAGGYFNIIAGTSFTSNTGIAVNGVRVQSEVASGSISHSGRLAAFECLTKSGAYQDWDYGLYVEGCTTGIDLNDGCTTGIDIGACTTGLLVSGATTDAIKINADATTGINITSNCTPADGILIAGACADGIEISGACTTAAINISTANLNGIRSVYNVGSQLGQYVQGIKMEHTRSADIQPSTGGWWGIQVVLNAGTGYAALDQPAYVIHGIFKGDATDPSTDCINVARFETQSDGKVEDVLFVSANAGSTVEGDIGRFVAHVAPTRSILALQNGTVGSTPCALYIDIDETMTSGIIFDTGAALTNCIRVTAATNTSYFILADAEAGCFPNYVAPGNAIANIKVRIAGVDGYIKVYDAA